MELFDQIITDSLMRLNPLTTQRWAYDPDDAWPDAGKSELILQRDMAFELGGSDQRAVNYCCVTSSESVDAQSETILCGPDLESIDADCSYARISLVRVSSLETTEDERYRQLCDAAFVKYRVFPKGFMIRSSPENHREQVRVSRDAIAHGLSFRSIGGAFIRAYQALPNFVSAKILFVTDQSADFEVLYRSAIDVDARIKALNTILSGLPADCASCKMKPLCDEVEGMRELHNQRAKS